MTALQKHLSAIGRKGGSAKSETKAAQCRANGRRGGRPALFKVMSDRGEGLEQEFSHWIYRTQSEAEHSARHLARQFPDRDWAVVQSGLELLRIDKTDKPPEG